MLLEFTDQLCIKSKYFLLHIFSSYQLQLAGRRGRLARLRKFLGKKDSELENQTIWGIMIGWLKVTKNPCFLDENQPLSALGDQLKVLF